jgi:hypothetical protein
MFQGAPHHRGTKFTYSLHKRNYIFVSYVYHQNDSTASYPLLLCIEAASFWEGSVDASPNPFPGFALSKLKFEASIAFWPPFTLQSKKICTALKQYFVDLK